jgi:hypothetical protein
MLMHCEGYSAWGIDGENHNDVFRVCHMEQKSDAPYCVALRGGVDAKRPESGSDEEGLAVEIKKQMSYPEII